MKWNETMQNVYIGSTYIFAALSAKQCFQLLEMYMMVLQFHD